MALTDRQKKTLKKHSVHHTKKHMAVMNSLMTRKKNPMTFTMAHRQALKIAGKQVAKKKNSLLNKIEHETRSKFKKTSQSTRRPKFSSMNKSKKRTFKKANRGGR